MDEFLQIIEDYDVDTKTMLGTYNFYQVLGLPVFGDYSEKNFKERSEYLEKKRKEVKDLGKSCIAFAKLTLTDPKLKSGYDEKLKRKFKLQSKEAEKFKVNGSDAIKIRNLEKQAVSLLSTIKEKVSEIEDWKAFVTDLQKKNNEYLTSITKIRADKRLLEDDIATVRKARSLLEKDLRKKNIHFWVTLLALVGLTVFTLYGQDFKSIFTTQTDQTAAIKTGYEWVAKEPVKVYKKPNNKSKKIGEASAGSQFHAIDETNYFIKIDFTYDSGGSDTGYIMKSGLKKPQ